MKRPLSPQAGYTLIELLLYVVLVGILLSGVTAFFGVTADARVKNQTISEVNDQGVYVMDYLVDTIRNATSVTLPATGGSGSQLTLVIPTASLSPTIFTLASGVLQVKEGANAAVALTSSKVTVSSFTVKNLSHASTPGLVQVSFTLNRINPNNRAEFDYQQTYTDSVAVRQ